MSTNFGSAGIPGTRLKVCGGWLVGGSHIQYRITPVPRLGAGALMLNAWDWTVTISFFPKIGFTNYMINQMRTKHLQN